MRSLTCLLLLSLSLLLLTQQAEAQSSYNQSSNKQSQEAVGSDAAMKTNDSLLGSYDSCSSCDLADACGCDACDASEDESFSLNSLLFGDCHEPGIDVYGWTQFGYHSQSTGLFNSHPDDIRLHQQWFGMKKAADGSEGLSFGFGVDFVYGYDAADTQAFGDPGRWDTTWNHGSMGWALPQLYGEVACGDWAVKAGHFYTLVGYEVVQAPDNFFYSHSFTQYTIEPFTHTGAYATYSGFENLTLYGGWTLGWDTGFSQFDEFQNARGNNFLGGASLDLTDDLSVTYITTFGDFGLAGGIPLEGASVFGIEPVFAGEFVTPSEGYQHSIVVNYEATEKLSFVFQTDYLGIYDTVLVSPGLGDIGVGDREFFSMVGYMFYEINDYLSIGQRLEWLHMHEDITDISGFLVAGDSQNNQEFYEYTVGVNVKPHSNLVIRPEYRYQWGSTEATPWITGDLETSNFGVDVILTY